MVWELMGWDKLYLNWSKSRIRDVAQLPTCLSVPWHGRARVHMSHVALFSQAVSLDGIRCFYRTTQDLRWLGDDFRVSVTSWWSRLPTVYGASLKAST